MPMIHSTGGTPSRRVTFEGPFTIGGQTHSGSRTFCADCDALLREEHDGCCGYATRGFSYMAPHICPLPEEPRPYAHS